jgi:hypothetical protein
MGRAEIETWLTGEWEAIRDAPVIFIAAVIVISIVIWRAMEWRYAGEIARLRSDRDDWQAKASAPVRVAEAPAEATPRPLGRSDKQRALDEIRLAMEYARVAIGEQTIVAAEGELPRMRAALLTANKHFGIEIPSDGRDAVYTLEKGRRLLREVYPLLKAGHTDEARASGAAFVARLDGKG